MVEETMKKRPPSQSDSSDTPLSEQDDDVLWSVLSRDKQSYPVENSSWFAARVAAIALQTPQKGVGNSLAKGISGVFSSLRWWVPIPLAGVAAITFLVAQHGVFKAKAPSFPASSEAEFEQHIEMIAYSD